MKLSDIVLSIVIILIVFGIGFMVGRNYDKTNTTRPVEEIVKTDSLIRVNDSIKIKIDKLDSIKDAKIIEVETLDKDSSVKLFYELINK